MYFFSSATTNLTANANHDLQEFERRLKFVRESADTADAPTYTDHINTNFMVLRKYPVNINFFFFSKIRTFQGINVFQN